MSVLHLIEFAKSKILFANSKFARLFAKWPSPITSHIIFQVIMKLNFTSKWRVKSKKLRSLWLSKNRFNVWKWSNCQFAFSLGPRSLWSWTSDFTKFYFRKEFTIFKLKFLSDSNLWYPGMSSFAHNRSKIRCSRPYTIGNVFWGSKLASLKSWYRSVSRGISFEDCSIRLRMPT